MIVWKRRCTPPWRKSCEPAKRNGLRGTNGVLESRDFSSWNSRAFTESHCAASVVSWNIRKERQSVLDGELKAPKQNALGAVQSRAGGGGRGGIDSAMNRGMRMNGGVMCT